MMFHETNERLGGLKYSTKKYLTSASSLPRRAVPLRSR